MKNRRLTLGMASAGLLAPLVVAVMATLTPQPAGACSCIEASARLSLVEVRLSSPAVALDETESAALEDEEALRWSPEATLDARTFWGDDFLFLREAL